MTAAVMAWQRRNPGALFIAGDLRSDCGDGDRAEVTTESPGGKCTVNSPVVGDGRAEQMRLQWR